MASHSNTPRVEEEEIPYNPQINVRPVYQPMNVHYASMQQQHMGQGQPGLVPAGVPAGIPGVVGGVPGGVPGGQQVPVPVPGPQPVGQGFPPYQQKDKRLGQRPVMTRGIMPNGYPPVYRRPVANAELLKLLDFCELVGVRSESTKNILYWKKIITEYFSEMGVLRYSVKSGMDQRQFEFSVPIIPRFFFSIIQSGVSRIEIQPGMLRVHPLANGSTYIESLRCCFTHHYTDGSYVNIYGTMKGVFNMMLKFEWLDFQTHVFIPGLEWPSLEKLLSDDAKMAEITALVNEKDEKEHKLLQKMRSNYQVFHSMSNFGLQESVMRVMQVSDVMAHLKSLMLFSLSSTAPGPLSSLDEFVAQQSSKQDEKKHTPGDSSPQSPMTKKMALDMSHSTLTKRRRKSTIGELSPKSTGSPKPKSTKKRR